MSEYQIRIINFVAVSLFLSLSRKLWSSESCRPVSFPVCVCVLLAYNVWIDVATVALPIAFWNKLQSSSCHIAQVHHKRIHILLAIMSTVSHLLLANCECLCDCSMCNTIHETDDDNVVVILFTEFRISDIQHDEEAFVQLLNGQRIEKC